MTYDFDIDPTLVERFAHRNGTVFVGAGISMASGLPSWRQLVKPLRADLGDEVTDDATPLEIAELFEAKHGRTMLIKQLRDKLSDVRYQLSRTHELVVSLPVQRIYTTNFDTFLEQASTKRQLNRTVIYNASHVGFSDSSILSIVKLHGDLADPGSLVITARDYYAYFSRNPAMADMLKVELQTRTVLFLGYGFGDPNLGMILGKVAHEQGLVRPLLYSLQLQPTRLAVEAMRERGVKVIDIDAKPGTPESIAAVQQWLEQFRQALNRHERRRPHLLVPAGGRHQHYGLPAYRRSGFGTETRDRIAEGLRSDFRVIVVRGEAGIGKTQQVAACVADSLAIHDILPTDHTFEREIWIRPSRNDRVEHRLEDILKAIADTLAPFSAVADEGDGTKLRGRVDRLLQERKVIVVIEDFNVVGQQFSAEDQEIKDWLESPGAFANAKSRIIVTTRQAMLTGFVVEVTALVAAETAHFIRDTAAAIMLRRKVPKGLNDDQIRKTVLATGGNPQAVLLALGLINSTGDPEIIGRQITSPRDARPIEEVLDQLVTALHESLDADARTVLGTMLGFSPEQPLPEAPLRRGSGLRHDDFSAGIESCVRCGLLERNGADGTLTMRTIPRELLKNPKLQASLKIPDAPLENIAKVLLEILREPDMICRSEISEPYWNALVRPEMARVDPLWPLLRQVMTQFKNKTMIVEFVFLLAHYMDNRLHNVERLEFVEAAIKELGKGTIVPGLPSADECIALLRIDALAWTYIEEQQPGKARDELAKARTVLDALDGRDDLAALADAWQARICAEAGDYVNAEECIRKAMASACKGRPDEKKWIMMRVHMIRGDVRMFQHRAADALADYREAEYCAETYGGEGNAYQTSPRIGLALLESPSEPDAEKRAEQLFQNLAHQHDLSLGQLYGEYGLAVIAARKHATAEAQKRLHKVYQEICLHTNSNVLLRLARRELEAIANKGQRNQRRSSDRMPLCH